MKKSIFISAIIALILGLGACESNESGKGVVNLSITDAPVNQKRVAAVYITVTGINYHSVRDGWKTFEEFEGPKTINLLDLTRGITELLGSFELPAGKYTQIRFLLDAPELEQRPISSPGCYIEFTNGTTAPLYVPSGGRTGYKAVGAFTVRLNGTVDITADFDVRKSIVRRRHSDIFILKPFIRVIVDNQAGMIKGDVVNAPDNAKVIVYAYEAGKYSDSEAVSTNDEDPLFPNAVSSDVVCIHDKYHIAFLGKGNYDLVVTTMVEDADPQVVGIIRDVTVVSRRATTQNIDFAIFQ